MLSTAPPATLDVKLIVAFGPRLKPSGLVTSPGGAVGPPHVMTILPSTVPVAPFEVDDRQADHDARAQADRGNDAAAGHLVRRGGRPRAPAASATAATTGLRATGVRA